MKYFKANLSQTEVLILQQINQDYEDSVSDLAYELKEPKHKIVHQIHRLKQKGLIAVSSSYKGIWISLTRKGHDLIRYLWTGSTQKVTI